MQEVLESAEFVAENGSLVRINIKALDRFVKRLDSGSLKAPPWDYRHHFYDGSEKTVAYLLALDTINFCFWPGPDQKPWTFRYGGKKPFRLQRPCSSAEKCDGIGAYLWTMRNFSLLLTHKGYKRYSALKAGFNSLTKEWER